MKGVSSTGIIPIGAAATPAPEGRITERALQPLRHDHVDREERRIRQHQRQRPGREIAMLEKPQVDDRIRLGQFPDQEQQNAERGHDRHPHDECRVEPVLVVTLVQHDLQRADAEYQRRETDIVDLRLRGGLGPPLHLRVHHRTRENADRHVDQERPLPRVVLGDPAAEQGSRDRRDDGHHRDHRQREAAPRRWIDRQHQRLGGRNHRSGNEALERAECHQLRQAMRQSAQQRSEREQQRRPDEQLHLAEALHQKTR
ncbi:hypothetical protein GGD41_007397 [Paraburkholderia bryophila]|uniref:Uncharacterized protein n=1 Tax=Paraburkholderia bryophila TaxID=420952 RepID=A0A7Y9WG25_9BURK|nr:hypothetical protein [Paraburkholderia bryophila]